MDEISSGDSKSKETEDAELNSSTEAYYLIVNETLTNDTKSSNSNETDARIMLQKHKLQKLSAYSNFSTLAYTCYAIQ